MTHSIREVLAVKPDGTVSTPLSDGELGDYLRKHYAHDFERRERHRLRDELYRDGGCAHMQSVVTKVFLDQTIQELRAAWIPHARYSNVLKQIVGETSSVYSEPAQRRVGGSDANERQYQAHLDALKFDEVMDYANRMLNLHRSVLLGPRVRRDLDGVGTLVVDVVTPSNVIAIVHPNDATLVIAWLIAQDFKSARTDWIREPKWQLWTDHEVGYLDKEFVPITEFQEHGLGINPWVALTYHAEALPGFWPGEDGADLVAAQVSIWMAGILMLKETKSATKQEIVTGQTGLAARGTPADTDVTREYPEGVTSTVVDRSMDPELFTVPSDHVRERVANGYGLALGALRHDMQSADAREAMMEPLRKLRRQQIKTFRRAEHVLVEVMARVLEVDAPDVAFTVVAFMIDFGEPAILMGPEERLALDLALRQAGLKNTLEILRGLNPDLESDEDAAERLRHNVEVEIARNQMMRPLQEISGSLGAEVPDAGTANNATPKPGSAPNGRPPSGGGGDDFSWVRSALNAN